MYPSVTTLDVGLTGGIACGKSFVGSIFRELGAIVLDADRIGHEVLAEDPRVLRELVVEFGQEILDPRGAIDRRRLGALTFGDPAALQRLNKIVHPRILQRLYARIARYRMTAARILLVVEAPLLFEVGLQKRCRRVVVVSARPEVVEQRLLQRPGMTREKMERMLASQWPLARKEALADVIIENNGPREETRRRVLAVYRDLARELDRVPPRE